MLTHGYSLDILPWVAEAVALAALAALAVTWIAARLDAPRIGNDERGEPGTRAPSATERSPSVADVC